MAVISRAVRTSVVTLALAAGLATTAVAQNAMRTAPVPEAPTGETPDVLQQIGFDQRLDAQLPLDLLFVDERGETVELGSYFGRRPVLLALVYYECPLLCSQVLNGLTSALDVLRFNAGDEFDVVAVSFNPKEGPGMAAAKKRAYMERYKRPGTEGGWHFLTGPESSIAQLTEAVGFRYVWDDETKQFAHAAGVVLATPQGRLSRYYYGIEYSPRDLRLGIVEAAERKIGSAVDTLLLYCYHYDPTTGKYGLITMTLVRAGGIATILGMMTFWLVMWRREKQCAEGATR
jgi:protein SCO1